MCIRDRLCDEQLSDVPVVRIGINDEFVVHGSTEQLKADCGLTPQKVAERIATELYLTQGEI